MSALIFGSMAYDTIIKYEGLFKDRIDFSNTPLNASFLASTMNRYFGGCAGNIAYGLKILGMNPKIVATMGEDANDYLQYLKQIDIDNTYIKIIENYFTVQLSITNDLEQNQINTFYPGAMAYSHDNDLYIKDINNYTIGIVSPDGKEGMIKHINNLYEAKLITIFDPGQALPLFNKSELIECISKSNYLIVNDYEYSLLNKIINLNQQDIINNFKLSALIITLAEQGACLYTKDKQPEIISTKASLNIQDPTGCGDAFRAGFIYGLEHGLELSKCIVIANKMGTHKINYCGGQGYPAIKI